MGGESARADRGRGVVGEVGEMGIRNAEVGSRKQGQGGARPTAEVGMQIRMRRCAAAPLRPGPRLPGSRTPQPEPRPTECRGDSQVDAALMRSCSHAPAPRRKYGGLTMRVIPACRWPGPAPFAFFPLPPHRTMLYSGLSPERSAAGRPIPARPSPGPAASRSGSAPSARCSTGRWRPALGNSGAVGSKASPCSVPNCSSCFPG